MPFNRMRIAAMLPVALSLVVWLCAPVLVSGQSFRAIRLSPADALLGEEFIAVSSLRELSDGKVLVTDRREQRIVLVDFRTQQVSPVSRRGQGPGEYSSPPLLFPLAGDSSLLVARTQRRWILMHGPNVVSTLPPNDAALLAARSNVLGTDTVGRVLTSRAPSPQAGVTVITSRDSLALVFVDRASGQADTIARLRRATSRSTLTLDAQGKEKSSSFDQPGVMSTEEVAAAFPDGAVAIARLSPFRVDWRLPNGTWVRGDSLPIRPVPIDARQKQWYMKLQAGDDPPEPPETLGPWPSVFPPFLSGSSPLLAASDGRLLIRRPRDADHNDTRYLLINRRGQAEAELTLPSNSSIVGFGTHSAYVIVTDGDGIQRLHRHRWSF